MRILTSALHGNLLLKQQPYPNNPIDLLSKVHEHSILMYN